MLDREFPPQAYGWLVMCGLVVSLAVWVRMVRKDARLILIYLAALGSAFLGAKVV